jgi:hypothetical protein
MNRPPGQNGHSGPPAVGQRSSSRIEPGGHQAGMLYGQLIFPDDSNNAPGQPNEA